MYCEFSSMFILQVLQHSFRAGALVGLTTIRPEPNTVGAELSVAPAPTMSQQAAAPVAQQKEKTLRRKPTAVGKNKCTIKVNAPLSVEYGHLAKPSTVADNETALLQRKHSSTSGLLPIPKKLYSLIT
jgi:hypothetical protein